MMAHYYTNSKKLTNCTCACMGRDGAFTKKIKYYDLLKRSNTTTNQKMETMAHVCVARAYM